MDEEYVDTLKEYGTKGEVVLKTVAHERGLLHACVISEVIDSQGRWLLVKQAGDRQDAGQYVSPVGGHVSAGETLEEALIREAEEEVGLTGKLPYEEAGRAVFDRQVIGRHENHLFIIYKIFSDQTPVINHESVGYRYFSEEELRHELQENPGIFGDAFHFVVRQAFPSLLSPSSQKEQRVRQ